MLVVEATVDVVVAAAAVVVVAVVVVPVSVIVLDGDESISGLPYRRSDP